MLAVPSRSTITNGERAAAVSMSSMMLSSVTLARTSRLSGLPDRFAQEETGRLGSASMIVTAAPFLASSDANTTADVNFPAPPFGEAKTMVGIRHLPLRCAASYLLAIGKQMLC